MSFEPVSVNVNFAPVPVCQRFYVVRLVFCHPHFIPIGLVTVYNVIKSVNSAYHIHRVFLSMHCSTGIPRHFSYQSMKMLQALLCHHQIYFLLLELSLVFHFSIGSLIFH